MNFSRARVVLLLLAFAVGYLWQPAAAHVRGATVLLRFMEPDAPVDGWRGIGLVPVDESPASIPAADATIPARLYAPRGVDHPPGLVLVHGVHRLGIAEPRLVRFARSIASAGVLVLTPEVKELADYRVDARSIDTLGAAVRELRRRTGARAVGLMGLSFAGGLALLAAADARYASDVAFVVAVGAHDDLARVSRFFATNAIDRPDGSVLPLHAHDYGPLVLVYSHIEDFFPKEDVPLAQDALRAWLWEKQDEARSIAAELGEPSRTLMQRLFDHQVDAVAPELLHEIDRNASLMASVSPHGHLGSVRCPVLLVAGASDNVIPPTETLWLAHDLPKGALRRMLISGAIGHVELGKEPSLRERWAVVDFMAQVLEEAGRSR